MGIKFYFYLRKQSNLSKFQIFSKSKCFKVNSLIAFREAMLEVGQCLQLMEKAKDMEGTVQYSTVEYSRVE